MAALHHGGTQSPDGSTNLSRLALDLQSLMNNRETGDLVFFVGNDNVQFHAHRAVIWARCQNLRKCHSQFWPGGRVHPSPLSFTYKHYDPQLFAVLLHYIYTGTISLQDSSVFSVIVMAKDFGLPELLTKAEEYVMRRLNVDNACLFLNAALHLESMNQDVGESRVCFTDVCLGFIEQHAERCVTTEGWLELPKSAVIRLVSSQKFSLEEDRVWVAILSWAKYNAGIPLDKAPRAWNDREKQLVAQASSGILEHIKLFLITSQLFAEEVEPTGLIPMETILERYRYAAVSSPRPEPIGDTRLQPRVSQQLFLNTTILSSDHLHLQPLLNQWCKREKQQWNLLYRASRDGYTAESFHKLCDGHAPTFVIVKGGSGCVCGGYSDVPWTSSTSPRGRYIPSHRAFLFTLVNNQDVPPTKYDISNSTLATLHHPHYGPMFGGGADLCIADGCNSGMESYSNFPHSYHGDRSQSSILMGDYNFNVADYEVFTAVEELL